MLPDLFGCDWGGGGVRSQCTYRCVVLPDLSFRGRVCLYAHQSQCTYRCVVLPDAMCDLLATRANWPSCEAGSTSVGLETSKVVEGETLHYLWFVSSDLMVRCYRTINPTFTFIEGDWGLTRSPRVEALTEEIGVYQASISSEDGAVELPQQFHSDINRLLLEEVNAA